MKTYTPDELAKILADHAVWLADNTKGARANLSNASLRSADLSYANLSYANLSYVNLSYASLRSANLSFANLSFANLSNTSLRSADLSYANLSYANLSYADLSYANLSNADLPAPTVVLLAAWDAISPALCLELMRYDAANIPDGEKRFALWASGGGCPYTGLKIQRCANFDEARSHWSFGPAKSAYELMVMLIREKCKDSDYHDKPVGKD